MRNCLQQADIEAGRREGMTSAEPDELPPRRARRIRERARMAICDDIAGLHNRRRRHFALDYTSPAEREEGPAATAAGWNVLVYERGATFERMATLRSHGGTRR